MSEPARKLSEEGAVRDAHRPFSSLLKRLFAAEEPAASVVQAPQGNQPESGERAEEFWNPRDGSPSTAAVRPMKSQFPIWKKDFPGLTDESFEQGDVRVNPPILPADSAQNQENSTLPYDEARTVVSEKTDDGPFLHRKQEPVVTMEKPQNPQENLDVVVDRLLRDKDFLLSEELKHKAEEFNQLLVQAQRQKMKVELTVSQLESRPGSSMSWLDVKIFKEI